MNEKNLARIGSGLALIAFCFALVGVGVFDVFKTRAQSSVNYFYVATAVDSLGKESIFSNEATCSGVTAQKPHCDLTWNASSSPVSGYNIYRGAASGGPYTKVNQAVVTVLTYSDIPTSFPTPPTGLAAAPGTN